MALRVSSQGLRLSVAWREFSPFSRWRSLHNGPDTVEELLERHLDSPKTSKDEEDERLVRQRLTSTRREALALYRDILRASRFFLWTNEKGIPWRDILRANARREFEEARFETDPEVIARLLVGGRDAVETAVDKAVEKHRQLLERRSKGDNPRS
uniref:Complex 1 LYR protein domain-containing protein n=1 Tax=Picea sitchensis TaxID=3332 RepID=D5AAP4_PICSI|nr:unknown [Picea sitchensis]